MKRLVFRKWVMVVLLIIEFLTIIVFASDYEDLGVFMITHLVALIVFVLNGLLISKYASKDFFE